MKGYWIGTVKVTDMDRYQDYVKANKMAFEKYGARFVVRGGEYTVKEGASHDRNVVIEFPSYQAALDCYDSPEYQAAKALRNGAAEANLIVIQGYEG